MKTTVDPRILLNRCLVKKGCKTTLAYIISLDAGGNQVFVDEKYLIDCGITNRSERQKYLKCLAKFYFSEMNEGLQ